MDGLHGVLKWIDHNRGLAIGLAGALLVCLAFAGCQPKTQSVLHPPEKVTGDVIQREAAIVEGDYAAKLAAFEIAQADLDRQYALRQRIVGIVGTLGTTAAGGGLNLPAGIAAGLQLLTLAAAGGAVYDNRRKDKKIKEQAAA